jgi:hypothetical protein
MGFFLLGKRRDDGSLVLVDDRVFDTRQDAIDALASIEVSTELESEVFAGDLDQATPVVVVHTKADEAAPEPETSEGGEGPGAAEPPSDEDESTSGVWEAPSEPGTPADAESEGDLAGALSRAADALEDDGIVAPESIGPADGSAEQDGAWPWDAGEAPDDIAAAIADAEPAVVDEPVAESEASLAATTDAEPETEGPTDAEEAGQSSGDTTDEYVPDPFEEPAVAVSELVPGVSDEDADLSKPVIMGAYGDEPTEVEETEETVEDEAAAVETEEAEEPTPAEEPPLPGEDPALESVLADLEIPEDMPDQEPPPPAVEPASPEADEATPGVLEGTSDLADLTCDDCVYLNTCPKRGESDPASCGSFQWKST